MKIRSPLATGAIILLLAGGACSVLHEHVAGTGEVVRRPVSVEVFHGIVVQGPIDVDLVQGNGRSVEVEAQPNIAELLTTSVKDGIWYISTSKDFSTNKPFIVYIQVPEIDLVHIEGSGDVKGGGVFKMANADLAIAGSGDLAMELLAAEVRVSIEGSGDARLIGTCTHLSISIKGSGDVDSEGLVATDADVKVEGSGEVHANASGRADIDIAGSGDVILAKRPAELEEHVAGSGEVRVQ